jgi:lysophospholipase-1
MMELEQQDKIDSKALGATKTSGIIFLHGLGIKLGDGRYVMCNRVSGEQFGLSFRRNKIVCPLAPKRVAEIIRTIIPILGGIILPELNIVRSWFDFSQLPLYLVRESDSRSESKPDLEEALGWVEEEIEKMIQEGIPSENIVLSGMSQGGALTLYSALHTRYKLGGFLPVVTWLPLLQFEPPASLPTPINKDTPIFHINGNSDLIVPEECGLATATAMEPVFTKYEQKNVRGTHLTTLGLPSNSIKIYCWLKNNVPGMAFKRVSPLIFVDCTEGNLFSFLVDY